jgi:hypothetical protein
MFINQLRFFVGEYHFFLPWHLGILAWSQICVCECLLNHHFLVGVFQYTVDGIGHDFFESPMGRPHPIQIRSWYLEQGNQHRKLMGQSAKLTKCKWPSLSYRYYLYDILWYYNLSQLHIYIYISPRYVRRRRVPWLSMVDGMVGCRSPAAKQKRCHAAAMRLAEPCIPRMATGVCVGSDSTGLVPENGIELPCPLTTAAMPIFWMILLPRSYKERWYPKEKTPLSPIAHILLRHTRCHYLVSRLLLMIKCRCVLHV